MKEKIIEKFKEYGFNLSDKQAEQFNIYMEFLLQENEKYNLTAITNKDEIIVKHFIDSVLPISKLNQNALVVDVGTGAGFPGVPLKILRNDLKIVLLDSLQKRINFLQTLVKKLELSDVECVHARSEDYAKLNRERFDYALSRAVAAIPTLSEYLLPLVKVGGQAIMYKGIKAKEELSQGEKAIKTLGGKAGEELNFNFAELGQRTIIIIDKTAKTLAKYPRPKNLPKLKPIL